MHTERHQIVHQVVAARDGGKNPFDQRRFLFRADILVAKWNSGLAAGHMLPTIANSTGRTTNAGIA